jgi:hypothetical protein
MTTSQMNEVSRKIISAIMLKDFAVHSETSQQLHSALAAEAEAIANKLLEV